jgi:hypothetical protein
VSGVADVGSNKIIPRPTTYFLGWDAGHLYLACRTYLRPGYRFAAGHRRRCDPENETEAGTLT